MRHWNSPNLNPLTNKNNEKSEIKTGANIFLIQYALYIKHICFRLQLTLILVVAFVFFKGSIFCCIQPFLLKSDGNGRYMYKYPIWLARAFVQCNAWTKERRSANCIGARPIVRLSGHSCDPIALSHSTRFHCTSVARFIARFTAFTSQNGALNRASFVWVLFHLQIPCEQFTTHIWYFQSHEYFVALLVRQLWKGLKTLLNLIFRYSCVKNKTFHFNLLWYF